MGDAVKVVTTTECQIDTNEQYNLDVPSLKLADIWAREARLAKWEEELKVKEGKLEVLAKEKLKLESYGKKMENKVNELTKIITTIKVRI